jgi:uncharacterized protein (TIRG00374 family)
VPTATVTHSQANPHFHGPKVASDVAKPPAKKSSRKRWTALILGAALSIVLPVLAFQGVNVSKSWTLILSCDGTGLALAALFFLATVWFRSWRWKYLLAAQQEVRLRSCVSATCVGFLANNILPFRLGDLVRVGALRQLENASAAKVLGTVAVERILDILTLVFFLGLYLAFATAGPHHAELMGAGLIALAGGLFLSAVMVVGYWRRRWLQSLFSAPVRWINPGLGAKVSVLVGHFLEGLQVFASPGQVARTVLLSIGLWAAAVGSYFYIGQSLGLDLPLQDFVVVVFTTAFGAIIPAAPGGVGTFHSFAWMGLYLVAMHNGEKALAFAGLLHAMEWMLMNVTGLFFLWRDRLHLTAVAAQEAVPEDASDATPTPAGRETGPAPHAQPV